VDEGLGKPKSTFFYFFYFLCVSARIQWVVKNEKRKNPKESAALTTRGTTEEKEMERSRSSRVQCRAAIAAAAAAAHLFKYYTTPVHHQHQSGRKGVRVYQRNGQNIYRLERTTTREAKGAGGGGTDNTTYFFSLFSSTTTYGWGI
jgi:hypothetical protein